MACDKKQKRQQNTNTQSLKIHCTASAGVSLSQIKINCVEINLNQRPKLMKKMTNGSSLCPRYNSKIYGIVCLGKNSRYVLSYQKCYKMKTANCN